MIQKSTTQRLNSKKDNSTIDDRYGIEYFHIYTDEKISERHTKSLEHLSELENTLSSPFTRIILIDDYNPSESITSTKHIINYLDSRSELPDYYAHEKDLINNADIFLQSITNDRTLRNYKRYIQNHNKYPCSLLTAAWYLTRLGYIDNNGVIKSLKNPNEPFIPSTKLINILPDDYGPVEKLANKLILKSKYSESADKIKDLFYSTETKSNKIFKIRESI